MRVWSIQNLCFTLHIPHPCKTLKPLFCPNCESLWTSSLCHYSRQVFIKKSVYAFLRMKEEFIFNFIKKNGLQRNTDGFECTEVLVHFVFQNLVFQHCHCDKWSRKEDYLKQYLFCAVTNNKQFASISHTVCMYCPARKKSHFKKTYHQKCVHIHSNIFFTKMYVNLSWLSFENKGW